MPPDCIHTTATEPRTRPKPTVEKTDALADNDGTGGVTITSVHTITNYQGPGTPTVVDTTPDDLHRDDAIDPLAS
jgi:hypothetical protein